MRRFILCLALGLGMLCMGSMTQAYTVGNPMSATGVGKLAMSAEYEHHQRELADDMNTESARYLVKASYGLSSWLDIFAKAGGAGLVIPLENVKFDGDNKFAWGAGARAKLLQLPVWKAELFSSAQLFSYRSRGVVNQLVTDAPQSWTRSLSSEYIWWEYGGALGIRARQGFAWPYVGLDLSYVAGEKNTTQYNLFSYGTVFGGESNTSFSGKDIIFSGFGGIDLNLPYRYQLSFEVQGSSWEEVSFSIGISQRSP
jgi:hypothetical protein